MPTYEYECKQCQRIFEKFQSMSAKPVRKIKTDCKECNNSAPVRRLIGAGAAVIFKGGGFYETDYRTQSYKDGEKAEKDSAKKATEDKSGDKKSDTKKTDTSKSADKKSADKQSKPAAAKDAPSGNSKKSK